MFLASVQQDFLVHVVDPYYLPVADADGAGQAAAAAEPLYVDR